MNLTIPWLTERHYAHRLPAVTDAFGLFIEDTMEGVCTFGPPPRMLNDGYGIFAGRLVRPTFELNRLVVGDDLPPNALSRFVSGCLVLMPKPSVIVSYADPNKGHHGYIYQATNWLYTGTTQSERRYTNTNSGKELHARTVVSMLGSRAGATLPDWIDVSEQVGKHRYLMFLGDRSEIRAMKRMLAYEQLPYPKGANQRYEAAVVGRQTSLLLNDEG